MRRYQRGGHSPGIGVLLLGVEMLRFGLHRIPPVTLGAIGLNALLFMAPWGGSHATCLGVEAVWGRCDWRRLALAPVHHADDMHLYFNMISALWKGVALEGRLGSVRFGTLLLVLSALTGVVQLALAAALAFATGSYSYMEQCAIGFSGVLFGLKVINNHYNPGGVTYVMNTFPVQNRYACWAELVVIHLLVPRASFIGHLSGILVGLFYVHGPLRCLLDNAVVFGSRILRRVFYSDNADAAGWHTHHRYEHRSAEFLSYTGETSEDEDLQEAMRASLRDTRLFTPPEPGFLSPEELRRRRLERLRR
ncbi:rhomboid-related protein 4 [Lampetra planeri]